MLPEVIRDENNSLSLQSRTKFDQVRVQAYLDPMMADTVVAEFTASDVTRFLLPGLEPNRRYYFRVEADDKTLYLAERRLALEGQLNFRDIGGYINQDGKQVRWGQVYRSGSTDRLTENDLIFLRSLNLQYVYDFRDLVEMERDPVEISRLRINAPIVDPELSPSKVRKQLESGDLSQFNDTVMADSYRRMLDLAPAIYGDLLTSLADTANLPAMFHCTAGKDRTGLAAHLLLWVLGIHHETILYDYNLTNPYTKPFRDWINQRFEENGMDFAQAEVIFMAPRSALEAAIDHISTQYGGVEAYLIKAAGMTRQSLVALRENLLYP